tara:strand:+ start:468 stop:605 length:138 start_codon:yes stop_codon:yes gene_type:complete
MSNKKQKDVMRLGNFGFESAINLNVIDEMSKEDLKRLEKVLNKIK